MLLQTCILIITAAHGGANTSAFEIPAPHLFLRQYFYFYNLILFLIAYQVEDLKCLNLHFAWLV